LGQHVAALIKRLNPDIPVRQLERDAGLREGQIARFRKPSETLERVPPAATLAVLAKACRCDPHTFFKAFCLDTGMPIEPPVLSDDEDELVLLFRRLSAIAQKMFLGAVRGLVSAYEAETRDQA
jgi:hypothetical protein